MKSVKVEHRLIDEQIDELGINRWAYAVKVPSEFLWICDEPETSYVVKGKAKVVTESEKAFELQPGDLIYCPAGSVCTWIISEELHTRFIMG